LNAKKASLTDELTPSKSPQLFKNLKGDMMKVLFSHLDSKDLHFSLFLAAIDGNISAWENIYKKLHPGTTLSEN